jgi:transposase
MLIVFSTLKGLCIIVQFYCSVLRRLRENIRRKRPELWRAGNLLLHDDNAPSHRALVTREFLTHNSIFTLPDALYSLDLAPCDFFLFPKMKLQLRGRRFDRLEDIHLESQTALAKSRDQGFQHAFQQWQRRWDRCVAAQWNYFEGDAAQT